MKTIDKVAPEHRDLVGGFPHFDPKQPGALETFRRDLDTGFRQLLPPSSTAAEQHDVPAGIDAQMVRLFVNRPSAEPSGAAILYIHGGGMIAGSAEMMLGASERLASDSGAVVFSVEYRLAPDAPFPAGLQDCVTALKWMHDNANDLSIDPARIAVMGDSGGGGLAAATALYARDKAVAPIRAQFLLYPMLDIRTGTSEAPSDNPLTGEFVWNRQHNRFAWNCVKGRSDHGSDIRYLSPALADDLHGLPPAYMLVGTLDLFLEEDLDYARRLIQAGVPVDLSVYAGGIHGFDRLPGEIGERASADLLAAIVRLV